MGRAIKESGLSRDDLYITTKYGRGSVDVAMQLSLDKVEFILTQFPSDSIFGDDKENVSPVKPVRTASKSKFGDPFLASAITTAEKNMRPATNKRQAPLEESLISIHS